MRNADRQWPPRQPPRSFPPKQERLEQRKPMTIVAGFPGSGFVALAADSEEGGGIAKSSVHKIALIDKGNCKCLIGGAGHGDFIDLAVQHAEEQIPVTGDVKVIRQKLETIVTDIYANRIERYPEHQQDQLSFELLCAVWSKKDGQPKLVRVVRSAALVKKTPEAIGSGTYLARYLFDTLGGSTGGLNILQAMRLLTHVIAQAKKYVSYCGGATQAVSIASDGRYVEIPENLINQYRLMDSVIVEDIARVVFYATDPISTEMNGEKLKLALEAGIAQWSARLIPKLFAATGLPAVAIAQQQQAAAAAAAAAEKPPEDQPINPTNSSTDQT
jgi:20S proteasome alpha/beta subunit